MKIKLLKQYGYTLPGSLLDPEKNIADELIRRGIAEVYVENQEPITSDEIEILIEKKPKGKKKK